MDQRLKNVSQLKRLRGGIETSKNFRREFRRENETEDEVDVLRREAE